MKTTAIIILTAALAAGCAAPVYLDATGAPAPARDLAECDYDATKATATIRSGAEQGFMAGKLLSQCMAMRGFRVGGVK